MRGEKLGLFEKIFKYKAALNSAGVAFKTLTGYAPAFTTWNGKIYESLLVRSAIHARATHISKLSIIIHGSAKPKLCNKLRRRPNDWQTWGQFLYRLSTILDVQNTAFIVPVLDEFGDVIGIYPVLASRCELREYAGTVYLRYAFASGQCAAVEFDKCGVMTKFQYEDDFFGSDNEALRPTMDLINIQNQGISEAVRSSATFRFMARMTNFASPEDMAKERKRFTRNNLESGGGLLLFPNTYDNIQQIKTAPYVVDSTQMAAIERNVYGYYGVNEDVLQNKAYGDTWNAFYEGCPEWFSIQFSEVLTNMLFTEREQACGAALLAAANRLQYMSNKEKMMFTQTVGDRGLAMRDEIRAVWNLPPLPDGKGQTIPMRGEYYNLTKEEESNDGTSA